MKSLAEVKNELLKKRDELAEKKTYEKHNLENSREYAAWAQMKQRCYNKKNPKYKFYGFRGITVCDSWKNSFLTFLKDLGKKPSPKHSLDRIDVNGNYESSNCRWATSKQQNLNKDPRKNKMSKYKGVYKRTGTTGFFSYIKMDGKQIYLGSHKTQKSAAMAYDSAYFAFHGHNLGCNFKKELT